MKKLYKAIVVMLALMIGMQTTGTYMVFAKEIENMSEKQISLSVPQNVVASPNGNGIIKVSWNASSLSNATGNISYLIYRSDTADGKYEKVGFNSKGTFFNDVVESGKTYYYQVRAYIKLDTEYSSDYSETAHTTANTNNLKNEFYTTADAVEYLKRQMTSREGTIEFSLWYGGTISAYSKELYNQAIKDLEDFNPVGGDYIYGHLKGYDCELFDHRVSKDGLSRYTFTYTFDYYTNKTNETQVVTEAHNVIDNFNLPSDASEEDKIRAVYEYLSKNVKYDLSYRNGNARVTAYDALILKKSVCQGYANATYNLLRTMGINNRIVMGHVVYNGENRVHAWNIVEIGGKWYNLDSTIGAEVYMLNGSYDYRGFLKNSADFSDYVLDAEYKTSSYKSAHPMTLKSMNEPADLGKVVISQAKLSNNAITLNWNKLDNARGYNIFRSEKNGAGFKQIGSVMNSTKFVDSDIVIGKEYIYKIKPYNKANGTTNIGAFSNEVEVITLPSPRNLEAVSVGNDRVHLSWDSVESADGFYVYRFNTAKNKYEKIATTSDNSFQDYNLTANRSYSYAVLAYHKTGSTYYYSAYSNESAAKTAEATKMTSAKPIGSNSVRIEWNPVTGSTGYNLYRADYREDGKYEFIYIKGTTSTNITDISAEKGKRYVYMVKPYTKSNGKIYYSDQSNLGIATTMNSVIQTVVNKGDSLEINWTATGTSNYNLYRYDNDTGNYVYLKSLSNVNTYTDLTVKEGEQYYYKLRPYTKVNDKVYYGDYSNGKSSVPLQKVNLEVETTPDATKLIWNKVNGARGYNIYRSTSANGKYEYVTGTSNSFLEISTSDRNTYYYKVRPYQKFDGNVYYADYSNGLKPNVANSKNLTHMPLSLNGEKWSY